MIYVYKMCLKVITVFIITLGTILMSSVVNAEHTIVDTYEQNTVKLADTLSSIDAINPANYQDKIGNVTNATRLRDMGNIIIGIIQFVGSAVSVIALIVIGIKYMMGSLEEKAQYKETMKPYIIGAFLVFGVSNLIGIIASIAESI